jgi:hypothetical protein
VKIPARRGRNEHPGVPDQPKPRRTSEQVAADNAATKMRADERAALIAEKRRQLAELEAEEALADQHEQTAFVGNVGEIVGRIEPAEGDGRDTSPQPMDVDLPETRVDEEKPDDVSDREEAAPKKTKKPRQGKQAAGGTGAEADASGKGKGKQKGGKKVKVITPTSSYAGYTDISATQEQSSARAEIEKMRTELIREKVTTSAQKLVP